MTKTTTELADELETLPVRTQVHNLGTESQSYGAQTILLPIELRDRILTALRTPSPSSIRREALEEAARIADQYRDEAGGSESYKQACGHIAAAIRALSPEPVDQWRPIASAPGGEWLLVFEDSGNPDIRGDYYAACFIGEPDDGYWIAACGQYVTSSPEPTHWMPIPTPPETVDAPVKGEGK